jgi:hypothetical protein
MGRCAEVHLVLVWRHPYLVLFVTLLQEPQVESRLWSQNGDD